MLQNRIDENLHFTVLPVSMKDSLSFWCFVFLLHCLIYKVQTAHSRRSFILTHRFEPVKHFFQLFSPFHSPEWFQLFEFQAPSSSSPSHANFYILPRRFRFVKSFFHLFRNFPLAFAHIPSRPSGAQLIYQIQPPMSTPNFDFFKLFSPLLFIAFYRPVWYALVYYIVSPTEVFPYAYPNSGFSPRHRRA